MIPLSVPNLNGNEWKYVKESLDTNWVSSVGPHVTKFEKLVAEYTNSAYAIATSNGTSALHISLLLSGVKPNDYVIVPNITFIASVNSIKYAGASPVLIDINKDTLQIDIQLLKQFIFENCDFDGKQLFHKKDKRIISAIMPVHVLGNMCNMDEIIQLASKFKLKIIEDSTESLGSAYKEKHSGTFGLFGCFSFNGNKIITTGGGGMIVTSDREMAIKAKHLTTQAKCNDFEYDHDEVGYNYRLVNILAAMGLAQMEQLPDFIKRKKEIKELYDNNLTSICQINFIQIEKNVVPNNWLYTIKAENINELISFLIKNEIQVRKLWKPMNQLEMFKNNHLKNNS